MQAVTTRRITNDVLSSLPPTLLRRLNERLEPVEFSAGQVLFEAGDAVDHIYFPESGLLSLVTPLRSGQDAENAARGRDGALGLLEASGSGLRLSRAVAHIAGAGWRLRAEDYRAFHNDSPALREAVQRRIEILLAEARQAAACRAAHPAAARLGHNLLECHDRTGEVRLPLGRSFLAGLVGVGPAAVAPAAVRLQDLRLIRYSGGVVTLLDVHGLKRNVCECYEVLRAARARILQAPSPAVPPPARRSLAPA